MDELLVVFAALQAFRSGTRLGRWLDGIINGNGHREMSEGLRLMKRLFETQDLDFANQALRQFDRIQSNDKKYIIATAFYCKSFIYALKHSYNLAYDALDCLMGIQITVFTEKKDIICSMQNEIESIRASIKEMQNQMPNRTNEQLLSYNPKLTRIESTLSELASAVGKFNLEPLKSIQCPITQKIHIIESNLKSLHDCINKVNSSLDEVKSFVVDSIRKEISQQILNNALKLKEIENKMNKIDILGAELNDLRDKTDNIDEKYERLVRLVDKEVEQIDSLSQQLLQIELNMQSQMENTERYLGGVIENGIELVKKIQFSVLVILTIVMGLLLWNLFVL